MKLYTPLILASMLLVLPACEQNSGGNQANGVKDAVGARPYEDIRDGAEDAGDAIQDAGQDLKDAVSGS